MKQLGSIISFLLLFVSVSAQELNAPTQAEYGPGGADYLVDSVEWFDFAKKKDGYWLFLPHEVPNNEAGLVVFLHGYGAYNPMIYGQWIRHIVRKGNVVIFPRYQKSIYETAPNHFGEHSSTAIRNALSQIDTFFNIKLDTNYLHLVGHSYGGVIATDLAMQYQHYQIPNPSAIMLVCPGTGPFKGGLHESYEELDPDLKMLIVVNNNDYIVGDKVGKLIYETAPQVQKRNLVRHIGDRRGEPAITSGHNESYGLDMAFDTGLRNYSAKKALRVGKIDAVDFNGYWKLFDALTLCDRLNEECDVAFGDTDKQKSLGMWNDSTYITPFQITVPEKLQANKKN